MPRWLTLLTAVLCLSGCGAKGNKACGNGRCDTGEGPATCAADCAEPTACYRGTTLPAGFTAFAASSPWRTPIEAAPVVDDQSANMISTLQRRLMEIGNPNPAMTIATDEWTAPIHVIDSDACEKVSVTLTGGLPEFLDPNQDQVADDVPVPPQAWPDPQDDSHLVLVDPTKRLAWEFWNFERNAAGRLTAGMMGRWALDGPGFNDPTDPAYTPLWKRNGANAPKMPYIGGLITLQELAAGEINHALNVITPSNRKKSSAGASWDSEWCAPMASRTDGRHVGLEYIPEGSRVQLNPALDLDALGLNADTRVIARALQKYGAFVMDTGGGFGLKGQNVEPSGTAWAAHPDLNANLRKLPLDQFRVLKCVIDTQ